MKYLWYVAVIVAFVTIIWGINYKDDLMDNKVLALQARIDSLESFYPDGDYATKEYVTGEYAKFVHAMSVSSYGETIWEMRKDINKLKTSIKEVRLITEVIRGCKN